MDRYCLLTFRTDTGQAVTIKISHAKENPTVTEIKTAMDRIIATGIVDVIEGKLVSREDAKIISTVTTEYELDQ